MIVLISKFGLEESSKEEYEKKREYLFFEFQSLLSCREKFHHLQKNFLESVSRKRILLNFRGKCLTKMEPNRCVGWGVRPPNWIFDKDDTSESNDDEKMVVSQESIEDNFQEEFGTQNKNGEEMNHQEFAKWVSMKWNLIEFDGTKPLCERKSEWERFIEQFQRIISVRKMSSSQKLKALEIQSGRHLNDIIKIQRNRGLCLDEESYEQVIFELNSYFDQTCDTMEERAKFRELKMSSDESFVDFELRCEKQIQYCNFAKEQRDEELADALIRRSVPKISKHLRLMAPTFYNNIFAIIKQGTHLDHIRKEENEIKAEVDALIKPVMSVQREKFAGKPRYVPYPYQRDDGFRQRQGYSTSGRTGTPNPGICGKCSGKHPYGNCPAKGKRCMKCRRWNHFARSCRENIGRDQFKEEVQHINQVKFDNENRAEERSDEEN